ncbi:MAG TPA: DUF934 domain-containing protein [Methylophilus sp.]|nr:DUF934 domain-containing protein [Methylophilus sp.]HQQ33491.1 DUF934 domain-containing protein [Methylophilus sp.]
MSQLIELKNGIASTIEDDWTIVKLPQTQVEERKQAGKVVLFKLTGEQTVTPEQITNTVIPASGKIILPLKVFLSNQEMLKPRIGKGEIGVWLATHEVLDELTNAVADLNTLPIIAIFVERFADGRIFSLGNLLRTRYGYKNILRSFGDVLRDQLFFQKRCGFDQFVIRADRSANDAIASLNDFSTPYQAAVDDPRPAFQRYQRGA